MDIEFDMDNLYNLYEKIYNTCLENGRGIPYHILNNKPLSLTTDFNVNVSDDKMESIIEYYKKRRIYELNVFKDSKGVKESRVLLDKYYDDELSSFLKEFPQFNNIILK